MRGHGGGERVDAELDSSRESVAGVRLPLEPEATEPTFGRNPSAMSQRIPIAILALFAAAISVYLAAFQWGWVDSVWDPLFGDGSETVLSSAESERMYRWIGIPDAALGAWAYLTEVILALAGSERRWQFRPWLVLLFGLDVIPLGLVSVVLVVVQGVSVGAWCFLCLVTAAASLAMIPLAADEVWGAMRYLWVVWKRSRDLGTVWEAFLGRPSEEAVAAAEASTV